MAFSHALPYVLFVGIAAMGDVVPDALRPWLDPLRAVLAGAALLWYAKQGAYTELRSTAHARDATDASDVPARGPRIALAVGAGVAVGLLWPLLGDAVPRLGSRGGFDAQAAGEAAAPLLLGGRLLGSLLIVPFAEELLVRSLIPRAVDAGVDGQWRDRGVGTFTLLSAAASIGFFTLTHPEWLAALVAALLWTALLRRSRRLGDIVLSHAVANAVLAAWVLTSGETYWW